MNELTVSQLIELARVLSPQNQPPVAQGSIYAQWIGKYVICRSRNEGVNAGKVVAADATGVVLEDARRLWYHKAQSGAWYEAVAENGLSPESKVSQPSTKIIVENYSLTLCSANGEQSIRGAKSYEG